MEDKQKHISLQEATKLCNYSQEYLSLRARQGKLKAAKFGRNWVTTEDWLKDYFKRVEGYNNQINGKKTKVKEVFEYPPPDNLPVGELRLKPRFIFPNFKLAPTPILFLLVGVLLIAGSVFGRDSLEYVYDEVYPVVEEIGKAGDFLIEDAASSLLIASWDAKEFTYNILDSTSIVVDDVLLAAVNYQNSLKFLSGVFQEYTWWVKSQALEVKDGYLAANDFIEKKISNVRVEIPELPKISVAIPELNINKKISTFGNRVSKNYFAANDFIGHKINNIPGTVFKTYNRANDFTEEQIVYPIRNLFVDADKQISLDVSRGIKFIEDLVISVPRAVFGAYSLVNDLVEQKITQSQQGFKNLVSGFKIQVLKVAEFAVSPWRGILPEGVLVEKEEFENLKSKMEEFEKQPVVIKRIEVEKRIEPVKEITKEVKEIRQITKIDDKALAQFRKDIVYLEEEIGKRLYAPGGVVSQTIYVTEPVQSPKIYQENGEIVLQTIGSGNVILSAATGVQLWGQQIHIESTNALNPLIYLANKTRVGGDTSITGKLDVSGNLSSGGNITAIDATLSGNASVGGNITVTGDLTATGDVNFSGATATTTIAGGLNVDSGTLFVDPYRGRVGIGTTTLSGLLTVGTTTPSLIVGSDGNVLFASDIYLNFGSTSGSEGYGFRDNTGTVEYKNSGGSWAGIGSGGGGGSNWNLTVSQNALKATSSGVGIYVDATASSTFAGNLTVSSDEYESDTLFIDASLGRIGIGTTTLAGLLTVGTTTPALVVNERGLVGMGTTTLSDVYQLSIDGQLYTSATTTIASDLVVSGAMKNVSTKIVAASDTPNGRARADYVADGTNDQVEIQDAINALPSNQGGIVYLLEGTYYIGSTTDESYVGVNITASSTSLIGFGRGTILQRAWNSGSDDDGVITVGDGGTTAVSGVVIANLSIDGQKDTYTSSNNAGIIFDRAVSQSQIRNTWVYDNNGKGIDLDSPTGSGDENVDNMIIDNDVRSNGSDGIRIRYSYRTIVSGNNVQSSALSYGSAAIDIVTSPDSVIMGNLIYDNAGSSSRDGINIAGSDNLIISSNRIYDSDGSGYGIDVSNSRSVIKS